MQFIHCGWPIEQVNFVSRLNNLSCIPRLSLGLSLAWSLAEEFLLRLLLVIESAKGMDLEIKVRRL